MHQNFHPEAHRGSHPRLHHPPRPSFIIADAIGDFRFFDLLMKHFFNFTGTLNIAHNKHRHCMIGRVDRYRADARKALPK